MVNYALTVFKTPSGNMQDVLDALETQLETVDDTKTIHLLEIEKLGSSLFIGATIYDT